MTLTLRSRAAWALVALSSACGGGEAAQEPAQLAPAPAGVQASQAPAPPPESPAGKAEERFLQLTKELEKLGKGETIDAAWLEKGLAEVLQLHGEHDAALFNSAVLKERRGDQAGARKIYEAIYERDPDFAPAAENLAASFVEAGDTGRAKDIYQRAIERDPKNVTSRLALARLYAKDKKYEEAIALARAALQQKADAIEAFRVLATSYQSLGNVPMAELIIGRGLKVDKDDAELHYLLAQILLDKKDIFGGVTKLKEVIKMKPTWLKVRAQLAEIALSYRDFGNAAQQFEAIVKADANNRAAKVGLGVSYKGMGRYDQAEGIYKDLLAKNADDADALWNIAVLYHRHLNRYDEAIASYQRAKAVAPDNDEKTAQVEKLVAELHKLKNDIAAAKAREERERKKREALDAACAAVRAGKKPNADAIGNDQERIEAGWQLILTGQETIVAGDMAGGEALVNCALEIIPDTQGAKVEACAPMRNQWTQVLYQLGRLDDALANTKKALACDPTNPDAQLIEQQLKEIMAAQAGAAAEPPPEEPKPTPQKGKRRRR